MTQRSPPHTHDILVTDRIEPAWEDLLSDGLDRHNESMAGYHDVRRLAVLVRGPDGAVVGGAMGRTSLGVLFLDMLYLPRALRGVGLGSEILRRYEAEGRRRGCRSGVLLTISFQAPEFYARHGWRRFGEIACDPPGTVRVFMTRVL